jgi:hypothetical protein
MFEKFVFVEGDMNDADYISKETKLNEADLDVIRKVSKALAENEYSWPTSEWDGESGLEVYEGVLTNQEISAFSKYVPYGEGGVRTIETIEIREVRVIEKLI